MYPSELQARILQLEAHMEDCIQKYGWFARGVGAGDDGNPPSFTYSIGFTETLGVPEVIITGFGFEMSHGVIRSLFDGIQSGRLKFPERDAKLKDVVTNDYDVLLRPIPHEISSGMATAAFRRPGNTMQEAWHLMLPDPSNLFPDDPGCDPKYAAIQDISLFDENRTTMKPL